VLVLLSYYGRVLRWSVMIRTQRPHPSHWGLFSATAIGFTAIVLFGRPGEFVRPYLISVKERLSFSSQMAAWLLERIYDLLAVLLIFGIALSRVQVSTAQLGPGLRWVFQTGGVLVTILALICVSMLLFLQHFSEAARHRIVAALGFLPAHSRQRVEELLCNFVIGAQATASWSTLGWVVSYTLLEWAVGVLCFASVFRMFPATAGFGLMDVLIFLGFVAFGSIVQIPGIGGGMQVVSVVVLTELFRLPLEVATSIAIASWMISFVTIVPIGLVLAFHEGLQWSKLRHLGEEEGV